MGMPPAIPPTTSVGHINIALSAVEILITFGQTKIAFPQGQVGISQAAVEWFHTGAMSPTAAQQLYEALGEILAEYKDQFGKIPKGPPILVRRGGKADKKSK